MTQPLVINIKLICPICSKKGEIPIEEGIINKSERGITAVNVDEKLICNHSFVAYVDKNYTVRDSFACDFKIQLPQFKVQETSDINVPIEFDVDIIKYNLIPSLLANIIKGILHGKEVAIINEFDYLNENYANFFYYLFDESFKYEISFITREIYKNDKKKYKEYLILKGSEIIQDKDKLIDIKKLKIEYAIVHKFFSELDAHSGLIILKSELMKLYKLSQDLIEFNDNLKDNENFTSKKAIDFINYKYPISISFPYLNLLMDIIKNYFKVELKTPPTSADVMGFF